jgi:hypothetical protein
MGLSVVGYRLWVAKTEPPGSSAGRVLYVIDMTFAMTQALPSGQ